MAEPVQKIRMSTIIPSGIKRKIRNSLERRLSVRTLDFFDNFFIQTRLIFSKSLLLMLLGLFAFFTWATIEEETFRHEQAFYFLLLQTIGISILLHIGLWETERDQETMEILLMRIPGVHKLIWSKMHVSLIWCVMLSLPFFGGYWWFLTLPFSRILVFFLFCVFVMLWTSFFTCIVSSFVRRPLPTGIISAIVIFVVFAFCENMRLPWNFHYYLNFMIFPYEDNLMMLSGWRYIFVLIVNRIIILTASAAFYAWLYHRLKRTEKWIA